MAGRVSGECACFGSLDCITVVQYVELALGLETAGYPFSSVIKTGKGKALIEDWISKNEFEERTKRKRDLDPRLGLHHKY